MQTPPTMTTAEEGANRQTLMTELGIECVPSEIFLVHGYRYSGFEEALAEARRSAPPVRP